MCVSEHEDAEVLCWMEECSDGSTFAREVSVSVGWQQEWKSGQRHGYVNRSYTNPCRILCFNAPEFDPSFEIIDEKYARVLDSRLDDESKSESISRVKIES